MTNRPTDAEFDELKRKRDSNIRALVEKVAAKHGIEPGAVTFHAHGYGNECYCACPDGPCQHIWDGPEWISEDRCAASVTCSRCGEVGMFHDMRCAP